MSMESTQVIAEPKAYTRLVVPPIERFIWDLTYACPLRCIHCYSESGRRPARMLAREDMLRVVDVIVSAKPKRISFSGGEPLLTPWWSEAARLLRAAGIPVNLFTSGWIMDEAIATELAQTVTSVSISVDGAKAEIHDMVRGRPGSFNRTMATLEQLNRVKRQRTAQGESCYRLGVDFTVTRSGMNGLADFVEELTSRFTDLDYVRFGSVIPEGLAQEEQFTSRELLTDEQFVALNEAERELAARARNGVQVSVTDVRQFIFTSPNAGETGTVHIEPDGQMRASTNFEAKVGNVLEEPLTVLWERAHAWRNQPFVVEQLSTVRDLTDWARVTRVLDRTYGSEADKLRIARRGSAKRDLNN